MRIESDMSAQRRKKWKQRELKALQVGFFLPCVRI